MNIPIASFPLKTIRDQISSDDWSFYINSVTEVLQSWLSCSSESLSNIVKSNSVIVPFLKSFFSELTEASWEDSYVFSPQTLALRQKCLLLSCRILYLATIPLSSFGLKYISQLCSIVYTKDSLMRLLQGIFEKRYKELEEIIHGSKIHVLRQLTSPQHGELRQILLDLSCVCFLLPRAGVVMMTGSDMLDLTVEYYGRMSAALRFSLLTLIFFSFRSLVESDEPNYSLLFDHLYSLAESAKVSSEARQMLADLIRMTPLKPMIREVKRAKSVDRATALLKHLQPFGEDFKCRVSSDKKGKSKAVSGQSKTELDLNINAMQNPYRMSLVSQIEDLFPNVETSVVIKLLDNYQDDVEAVTAHILEAPEELKDFNLTSDRLPAKESLPYRRRRNIHDGDELDTLTVDISRLHQGRSRIKETADDLLSQPDENRKAAAIAALATFDADDDERDDTYDADDVGAPEAENDISLDVERQTGLSIDVELLLLNAYNNDPNVFRRDAPTRRSNSRKKLCAETGLTDEATEGWALMLIREPKRLIYLKVKADEKGFSDQISLPRTAWRKGGDSNVDSTLSDGQKPDRRYPQDEQRSRGNRQRGRGHSEGGSARGNASNQSTQNARYRKGVSKGSGGNHNRREQHLKKMARGG